MACQSDGQFNVDSVVRVDYQVNMVLSISKYGYL